MKEYKKINHRLRRLHRFFLFFLCDLCDTVWQLLVFLARIFWSHPGKRLIKIITGTVKGMQLFFLRVPLRVFAVKCFLFFSFLICVICEICGSSFFVAASARDVISVAKKNGGGYD